MKKIVFLLLLAVLVVVATAVITSGMKEDAPSPIMDGIHFGMSPKQVARVIGKPVSSAESAESGSILTEERASSTCTYRMAEGAFTLIAMRLTTVCNSPEEANAHAAAAVARVFAAWPDAELLMNTSDSGTHLTWDDGNTHAQADITVDDCAVTVTIMINED